MLYIFWICTAELLVSSGNLTEKLKQLSSCRQRWDLRYLGKKA